MPFLFAKSATFFDPQKFAREGPKLQCNIRRPGWIDYKIKVLEEIHLEDDPHFPCRNYEYDGEYNWNNLRAELTWYDTMNSQTLYTGHIQLNNNKR